MDAIQEIRQSMGDEWLPYIYENEIRPLRTRSVELEIPERENTARFQETLLGYELKVGRMRIDVPNRDTARYLAVFARIGCRKVALPYDITAVPALADRAEVALSRSLELLEPHTASLTPQHSGRIRASLLRTLRTEIAKIGAGEMMPLFKRSTRQRHS